VAARTAQEPWQDRSAYNKSQIIYRIAEMLQEKEGLFTEEMISLGYSRNQARKEFGEAIDLIVHYAGWCDKYIQLFSSVNPVASSHFNFSVPEPMGVVSVYASEEKALLGIVQACIPAIAGGNTAVVLSSYQYAPIAVSFAETLAVSDLPGGVINILTGDRNELLHHFASHMDVNAFGIWGASSADSIEIAALASENVKRVKYFDELQPTGFEVEKVMAFQEIKTTWHPIEQIKGSGAGY
jgi:acyl-CoA reductase-like NAD-dependent aldehyde dehydrogenase